MSERIVVLGPHDGSKIKAAELPPMDAGAVLTGPWRVSLSLYTGPLRNATVIGPDPVDRVVSEGDWRSLLSICPYANEFELALPLELGEHRHSRGPRVEVGLQLGHRQSGARR